jgi:hypothetical protein
MKGTVVIFGANGFVGRYLTAYYLRQRREVVAVARERRGIDPRAMFLEWDGRTLGPWAMALEGAAMVINLAGRSVNCRYEEERKREILESRVEATKVIGEAIAACDQAPAVWMNSSTATIYRHAEDRPQDEWSGEPGEGFSVQVARQWEEAFFASKVPGAVRKVALRMGMVLANEPGTVFGVLGRLVRLGLGGAMGGGRQRVSWIHMDDLLAAIDLLEQDLLADGVFNLTAPEAPTNGHLMRALREEIGMPLGLPAARWMMEIGACVMRTETELVLKSRWAVPARLIDHGMRFRWPEIGPALADLSKRPGLESFFGVSECRALGHRPWALRRRQESI